jgi:hypothetical protein
VQAPELNPENTGSAKPARLCENCGTDLHGRYCHRCGQPRKSFIRALPGLIGDLASETLYYDSRMWRTLKCLLLKPGFLSSEHVQGRRARYTPPIRLYLVSSILAFLVVSFVVGTVDYSEANADLGEADVSVLHFGTQPWHPEDNPVQIDWLGDSVNAWLNRQVGLMESNTREAARNPARFVRTAAAMLPQTMFVILPLFSAWVGLFYLFAKRYYIEHLLLQVHNHAFLFLSLVALYPIALLRNLLAEATFIGHGLLAGLLYWIGAAIWLWIPIYILISQKRFYQQGWPLTLGKYVVLGASYFLMLLFALVAVILLGIWRL